MICWSCQKQMPDGAEFCPHCEAEAMEELPADAKTVVQEMLAGMSPDLMQELRDTLEKSASGEDFVNRIMVGDCPKCGSSSTGDCDNDPEISDPCVGRCLECGQLWCCDCGELFNEARAIDHDCPAWAGIDLDDEGNDEEDFDDDNSDDEDFSDEDSNDDDFNDEDLDHEDDRDSDDRDLDGIDDEDAAEER